MTAWWESREPRERVLLGILAGLVVLFLLVFAVLLPVQGARAQAQADLARAESGLSIVNRVAPTSGQTARAAFDRSALISVSRARGVKLARVQPGADGSLAVWIDEAQTEALYGLFEDLLTQYAATMERAVVSTDNNGRLSAQFTVR